MAVTAKIKLLRVLSMLQCWIAVWLVVLGIVEHVRVDWIHTGLGMPIWTGVWVGITSAFGIFITFKRVQNLSHGSVIPPHLVMTFMGFSLTCGILSTIFLMLYSQELGIAGGKTFRYYDLYPAGSVSRDKAVIVQIPVHLNARDSEQHALVGSIYGFVVVELIIAMWSVAMCLVNDQHQMLIEDEPCGVPLIRSPADQGQDGKSVASSFGYSANA